MEEFIKEPSKEALALLKKKELLNVAKHYKTEALAGQEGRSKETYH